MKSSNIVWLSEWYSRQANGDWEHSFGIKIETLDNPGWRIVIDLSETPLATRPFTSIKEENSPRDWTTCRIQDGKFEGFCGPGNLDKVLGVFRAWPES
ncbi:MAG: hypothetical protein JWM68_3237 [Verrucomicrobiales bacterium]|nr:hypothetical protein [Verrucomicrobiales bacterium]